jgi:hypothetical protein
LTPGRDRLGLAYQAPVDGYFTNEEVADSLQAGPGGLDGPLVVVWDNGGPHSGGPLRDLLARKGRGWTSSRSRRTPRS